MQQYLCKRNIQLALHTENKTKNISNPHLHHNKTPKENIVQPFLLFHFSALHNPIYIFSFQISFHGTHASLPVTSFLPFYQHFTHLPFAKNDKISISKKITHIYKHNLSRQHLPLSLQASTIKPAIYNIIKHSTPL